MPVTEKALRSFLSRALKVERGLPLASADFPGSLFRIPRVFSERCGFHGDVLLGVCVIGTAAHGSMCLSLFAGAQFFGFSRVWRCKG